MKQAGEPLQSLIGKGKSISSYMFKHILFQVLFSLAKAQEACEFMHNDLHLKNILIDTPDRTVITKYHEFSNNNNTWFVDSKIVVTIVDFGLSRITKEDGTIVHNEVHPVFLPSVDIEHLSSQFNKFKITSWCRTYDAPCTEEEEKEQKKLKRALMQRMRKGDAPALLIKHPFFHSMQEKPSQPSDLVIPANITEKSTKSPNSPTEKRRSLPPSPMSVILNQNSSPNIHTCLPKLPTEKLGKFLATAKTVQQQVASKTKAVGIMLSENKENILHKPSMLAKRKREQTNKKKPSSKRRKVKS